MTIASVLEETLPATKDNGIHHKPELVDEAASKQQTDESATAEDRDVLSRLPLEPDDLL